MRARKGGQPRNLRRGALLDAAAATRALSITRATLYVYVSRGLIRSVPHPHEPKACLYSVADIMALIDRRTRTRRPRAAAATALDYGLPVLKSRITHFEDDRCFYRDREAVALSRKATLEDAARLLWNTEEADPFAAVRFDPRSIKGWTEIASTCAPASATARGSLLLSLLTEHEVPGGGKPGLHGFEVAARLVAALVVSITGIETAYRGPIHRAIGAAWQRPKAADLIRRALVLLADHELNASTFAVRVVASTGAGLTNCVIAGLAAMSGPKHGGATERLRALLAEADATGDASASVAAHLSRGETLPGFGNSVYRDADPRGAELVSAVKLDATMVATLNAARSMAGVEPNVDFGLLALERSFNLPQGAALALFAMGRSVGWIAHAFEQRATGTLIRPRAEFVLE
ncbi:MAG: citrate synthase [Alphaproteobacteria bacterium]|nr:citrate synthase [Alphaproteobacteria bacterium]